MNDKEKQELIELRKQNISIADLMKKFGVSKDVIKRVLKKAGVRLDPSEAQKNARAARLAKNPNYMQEMHKFLTPEVVAQRSEKIREKYKNSPEIGIKQSVTMTEYWKNLPENERKIFVNKRSKAVRKSKAMNRYQARGLGIELPQGLSEKDKNKLMFEAYQKIARDNGGEMIGEYLGSHEKVEWKCSKGHIWITIPNSIQQGHWCPNCANLGPSMAQVEIFEFVKSLTSDEVILGDRNTIFSEDTGRFMELDIYIPSRKFAIEYNGLIFHSSKYEAQINRHNRKSKLCDSAGINLLAIFEDEWKDDNKRELLKSMIKHRLGANLNKIGARKLELKFLNKNSDFSEFFNRNHLDGHSQASWGVGLFLGEKLMACVTIRKNFNAETELCRFAIDRDFAIPGAASRLIKAISSKINTPLISFSNNRLSTGKVYQKIGFKLLKENPSSYWYTDGIVRVWRFRCKRINDPEILARFPEVEHTEEAQAMAGILSEEIWGDNRPLYKIEDYGHKKWLLDLTKECLHE